MSEESIAEAEIDKDDLHRILLPCSDGPFLFAQTVRRRGMLKIVCSCSKFCILN